MITDGQILLLLLRLILLLLIILHLATVTSLPVGHRHRLLSRPQLVVLARRHLRWNGVPQEGQLRAFDHLRQVVVGEVVGIRRQLYRLLHQLADEEFLQRGGKNVVRIWPK